VTMRRWTLGITAVIGLLGAFAQPPITEPLLTGAPWPTWGRDMRRSHFVDLAGPNTPAVLWFTRGGALEEPGIPGESLWVPQHPAQGSRYTRYTFYNPVNGRATGSFGPFWGQPSTPIFLNAAVFIVDNNGNPVRSPEPWEALMLSGGQYECLFYSPSPVLGYPDVFLTIRGIPAYRTSFGAFTDGNFIYPVYADNLGNIFVIRFAWRVVLDGSGNVQSVTPLYLQRRVYRGLPAALGTVSSNRAGSILLLGFHDGLVLALSTSIPLALPIEWLTTFQTLSGGVSDSVDRPIAVTSDESTAIVCGSNSGRVYGVAMADGSRQWEYQAGGAIMGGPSIGPDPNYGNEDTVYIVVRHSPTQSAIHAIQASNGEGKWVYVLPNVSRCTPTIDQNGVLYIGDERGFLYAINLDNEGQPTVKWQTYLSAPIRIAPVMGEFSYRGNPTTIMFVAASNRFLYAIVDQSVLSTGISPGTGVGGLGTVPLPGGAR
jgi:outer membrane protein assembly factor BamB